MAGEGGVVGDAARAHHHRRGTRGHGTLGAVEDVRVEHLHQFTSASKSPSRTAGEGVGDRRQPYEIHVRRGSAPHPAAGPDRRLPCRRGRTTDHARDLLERDGEQVVRHEGEAFGGVRVPRTTNSAMPRRSRRGGRSVRDRARRPGRARRDSNRGRGIRRRFPCRSRARPLRARSLRARPLRARPLRARPLRARPLRARCFRARCFREFEVALGPLPPVAPVPPALRVGPLLLLPQ